MRVLAIGDGLAYCVDYLDSDLFTDVNTSYIDNDYRIVDLINVLNTNYEKNGELSIHRLLNRADVLIVSVGMNDIYFKLNSNTKEIYSYIEEMIENLENLMNILDNYEYDKVIFLGYYNLFDDKNDIFSYLNYKARKVIDSYGFDYLELNGVIKNDIMRKKKTNWGLNKVGYDEISKIIVEKLKKY